MKILIAEDDYSSRKLLTHFIKRIPNYEIVAEATNGEELVDFVFTKKPNIALVDIEMPLLNGMEAVKLIKKFNPNLLVIFITGNENFAIEAFGVQAIDYILKPINGERLYESLERASNRLKEIKKPSLREIRIKQSNSIDFISINDILFIERYERKSIIHTQYNIYYTSESLTNLEKQLDDKFMMTHRSYIINLEHLTRIEGSGQMYIASFKNYNETAKVSKYKLGELQKFKSALSH